MSLRSALLYCFGCFIFLTTTSIVWAQLQEDMTIATAQTVFDSEALQGDIVSTNAEQQIVRTSTSFDPLMYGVVADSATMIYYPIEEGVPIIRSGTTQVNVTTLTGEIKPGDYITSSPIAGKGQKTTVRDGWIVGVALEPFSEGDGEQITFEERTLSQGPIQVSLVLGPAVEGTSGNLSRIVDDLGRVLLQNVQTPTGTNSFFRFLLAALIAIASIAIGFGSFGRNITRGIEAIGRNPLAKRQIQAMIILNIFLIALISLAGIILALAIIRY